MDPLSENSKKSSKDGNIKALMDGSGESSENIVRPVKFLPAALHNKTILYHRIFFSAQAPGSLMAVKSRSRARVAGVSTRIPIYEKAQ